jgi:hypothetical protein
MRLEYLSKIKAPPMARPGFWVFVIAVIGGFSAFGCWCLIDYMDVYAPERAQYFYPLWLVPVAIVIAWPGIQFRNMGENRRLGLNMAGLLGAGMLTAVLILGAGPVFHGAIGGNSWRPTPMRVRQRISASCVLQKKQDCPDCPAFYVRRVNCGYR